MPAGYIMLDHPNTRTAQGTYPRRGGAALSGTCIIHTSEGAWAAGVDALTNLVQNRTDYGCYHRACDWEDIALYYPWDWETWQDSETNNWAVGIAAACKTTDWVTMPAGIRDKLYRNMALMASEFVRYMAGRGITVPLRRITGPEARAQVPGFCAHADSGIDRTDPGESFEWETFFKYVQSNLTSESDDAMPDMNTFLNTPAFWTGETPGPTISEMFVKISEIDLKVAALHEAVFNNDGTNDSIVGGESIPGLINKNDLKILEATKRIEQSLRRLAPTNRA